MASASSIMSFIGTVGLAKVFGFFSAVIVFAVIYAVLAWFFAQGQHWAWITLAILSFNPVAWIINFLYLRKRWGEDSVATPTI
jgi:hypothetical protein